MRCIERSFNWAVRNSYQEKDGRWVAKEATEGFKIAIGDEGDYNSDLVAIAFEAMKDELKAKLAREVGLVKEEAVVEEKKTGLNASKLKGLM